jgi:catechol 2,3-dioxygenase-like lactoylglutathione lyase family enzyme
MTRSLCVALVILTGLVTARGQETVTRSRSVAPGLVANRVILRVTDLQQSVAFFRDRVGLPLQSTFDEFAQLDGGGGVTLMLQKVTRKSSDPSTGLSALTEIVLESPDILASYEAMKGRGVIFRFAPRVATTDGKTRDFYVTDFRDPDGHVLSIGGWMPHRQDQP